MNSNLFHRDHTHSQSLPNLFSKAASQNALRRQHSASITYTQTVHSKSNCIVLFDWDNTLFPTTAIVDHDSSDLNGTDLQQLSQYVLNILTQYAALYGADNVFIVTNGQQNWVLESLQIAAYLCSLKKVQNSFQSIYDLVANGQIKTISAQHLFAAKYPNQSLIWKYLAFHQILEAKSNVNDDTNDNDKKPLIVISIGDCYDEYNASKLAVNHLKSSGLNITLHRLKLTTKPNVHEMNKQFHLMMLLGRVFGEITDENIAIDYADAKADFLKKRAH